MQMASVCTQLPGAFVGYGGEPECFFLISHFGWSEQAC